MSLIHNERTKLLAGALDRTSTALVTVGVAVPLVGYFVGGVRPEGGFWVVAVIAAISIFVAFGLHLAARWVLGGLKP
jgi:hypothetical protein